MFFRRLGSLEMTLVALLLLGGAVGWILWQPGQTTVLLVGPLFLLAVNLLAAIATLAKFRLQLPLLVFHLALLGLILLVAMGRLTYLKGWVEVSVGAEFDGQLEGIETGPWHAGQIQRVRFTNESFQINYNPGPRRTFTHNRVSWQDAQGRQLEAVIGDQRPLVLDGYRFYTTHNKGFSPLLRWVPKGSKQGVVGDIHLPSYPANTLRQSREWTPPGATQPLWLLLEFDEVILTPDAPSRFRPPQEHTLVLREAERRFELQLGDRVELTEGTLYYLGLGTWMGYTVSYDWTRPWLIATSLVALFALGWHLWRRFFTRPWLQ